MNNKGVTLIELLIVIVVLGIISAFAIPAVGTIIENTEKDAILADAIAIENAAKLYCAQTTCTSTQTLGWDGQLEDYVQSFDDTYYEHTDPTDTTTLATLSNGDWTVTLEKDGDGTANSAADDWEWVSSTVPSAGSRSDVTDDDN